MALENATYISELVPSNPAGSDDPATLDDHDRLIKQVLQNQFPNFTAAAMNATVAELNKLAGLATTQAELAALNGLTANRAITTDASGLLIVSSVTDTELAYLSGKQRDEVVDPPGVLKPFAGITLPSGYLWANGQVASRTTYSALYSAIGDAWFQTGVLTTRTSDTAGVVTFDGKDPLGLTTSDTVDIYWTGGSRTGMGISAVGLDNITVTGGTGDILPAALTAITKIIPASNVFFTPDFRGRSFFGLDNMGGVTAAQRIASSQAHGVDGTLRGASGGVSEHQLTEAELASHQHGAAGAHTHDLAVQNGTGNTGINVTTDSWNGVYGTGFSASAGSHQHPAAGGDAAHTNLPPAGICGVLVKT